MYFNLAHKKSNTGATQSGTANKLPPLKEKLTLANAWQLIWKTNKKTVFKNFKAEHTTLYMIYKNVYSKTSKTITIYIVMILYALRITPAHAERMWQGVRNGVEGRGKRRRRYCLYRRVFNAVLKVCKGMHCIKKLIKKTEGTKRQKKLISIRESYSRLCSVQ